MKRPKITKRIIRNQLVAYSFIIISLITLFVLVYIPMVTTIKYSTYKVGLVGYGEQFVGFANYKML